MIKVSVLEASGQAFAGISVCDAKALRATIRSLLDRSCQDLGVFGAVIEQVDGDDLVCAIASHNLRDREGLRLRRVGSLSGRAVQLNQLQSCADALTDRRVDRAACQIVGLRSMVCAPFHTKAQTYVLKVIAQTPDYFAADHIDAIEAISRRLARRLEARVDGPVIDLRSARAGTLAAVGEIVADRRKPATVSSRQVLSAMERACASGYWTVDPVSLDMTWSEGLHALLGADRRTEVPRLDDLLHWAQPTDRPGLQQLLLCRQGGVEPVIARLRGRGGVGRVLSFHRDALATSNGLHVGVAHDVSAAQEAHSALVTYHAAFEGLVDLFGGMIWRADARGSPNFELGWCEYTGTTLAQNRGDDWAYQLHPEDRAGALQAWRAAVNARVAFAARFRVRRYDGAFELFDSRALASGPGSDGEWLGVTLPVGSSPRGVEAIALSGASLRPLPQELRAMRALAGWTIEDLAGVSGVSVSTIRRYEGGLVSTHQTRIESLDRLSRALADHGVRIVELEGRRAITQGDPFAS